MSANSRIATSHLARGAYVYVRQSTEYQVQNHQQSQQRQYELADVAVGYGWPRDKVEVIDDDLGRSGSTTAGRTGFARLVADVALGKAGIVLGLEVSRLARNNRDWYQLLDLCSLTATLIADADGVYDPASFNDRLLLGLKGTMSEAELHVLKGRMLAGLQHKARQGKLRFHLPSGYELDDEGRIVIPPKAMGKGTRYWLGGTLFGFGWALTGACPGPLFALAGSGVGVITFVLLSSIAGMWVYGFLRPRLPH